MLPRRSSRKKPVLTCFNIFLVLTGFQTLVLLVLGFLSDRVTLGSLSELENLVMSNFHPVNNDDDDDLIEMEEMIVDHTEKRLEGGLQDEDTGPPLDDYYSRQHFSNPVPVIIGGTDGSGTRAFADVLAKLGVPMIIDDPVSLDVHAQMMLGGEGWPPLARMVLRETHSANYELEDLASDTTKVALFELDHLHASFSNRYSALMYKARSRNVQVASKVTYGYKAPVTMLALPLLKQIHSDNGFKFIHVVRDGRDVSLSKNKSPIEKFYEDSYTDGKNRLLKYKGTEMEPVLGMHLWNDWNIGVLEWERGHADGEKFDYLVMRTEDLLDPEKKFESLRQLADFLGSPRTKKDLCCLSRRAATDMGTSDVGAPRRGSIFDGLRRRRRSRDSASNFLLGQERARRRDRIGRTSFSISEVGRWGGGGGWGSGALDTPHWRRQRNFSDFLDASRQRERERTAARFKAIGERVGQRLRMQREAAVEVGEGRRRLRFVPNDHPDPRGRLSRLGFGRPLPDRVLGGIPKDNTGENRDALLRPGKKVTPVNQRYGKWTKILEDKPNVVEELHRDGKEGLAAFGYEPRARFMDSPPNSDFQCDDRVVCDESK